MRSVFSASGNNSFNNLEGTGSNKHVVGSDTVISLFSSSCPIVVKQCSFSLGAMNEAEVLDTVESTFVIVFLIVARGAWFSEVCSGRKTQETAVSKSVKCKMRITCV